MNAAQSGGHAGGGNVCKKSSQIEELVTLSSDGRNWRGIFIALLVIAAVFSIIIFSIFLLTPENEDIKTYGNRFNLNDILSKRFQWEPFNGSWYSDVELIYRDINGGLSIINANSQQTRIVMTNTTFRQINADAYMVSPDMKYVLLQSDSSTKGSRYYIYEISTENRFPLGPMNNLEESPRLQLAIWSPINILSENDLSNEIPISFTSEPLINSTLFIENSSSTNTWSSKENNINQGIAFVYENDIYYKPRMQGNLVYRITTSGEDGVIYNGLPDWTYANLPELNNQMNSMLFSPNGQYLAYLKFNDSSVTEYKYTRMSDDLKYPAVLTQRYPKTGNMNPIVTVNIVELSRFNYASSKEMKIPNEITDCSYISALQWVSFRDLSFVITNRLQTRASTLLCAAPEFYCHVVHTEVTLNNSWVLITEQPIFSTKFSFHMNKRTSEFENFQNKTNSQITYEISNGGYLLKRLPVQDGLFGHYRHVVFISIIDRRSVPLTMGRFEVTEIVGWDEANELIYFMATPEKQPSERHLYKINLDLKISKTNRTYITTSQPICLTCNNEPNSFNLKNITVIENNINNNNYNGSILHDRTIYRIPNNCLYNKVHFSEKYSYYVQECLGPESPSIYLVETHSNLKIFILDAGDNLREYLHEYAQPHERIFNVEIRNGFKAQVKLYLPPEFSEDDDIIYPLVLHIDSSPGSQLVHKQFEVTWNWYLCTKRAFIVAQVDARGSGFQGELFRTQIYGNLGKVEVEDQLSVLKYLSESLKFIDSSRMCAYGWGYGGYATIMSLIKDSQKLLQCGVAINPITTFSIHYSIFTERYMPIKNNYLHTLQNAELPLRARNINGKNLMLIYSTADTFIHQEHTLTLIKALVNEVIQFRHQVYPDEDHFLKESLLHVYQTIEAYFDESLSPQEDIEWDPTKLLMFKQ